MPGQGRPQRELTPDCREKAAVRALLLRRSWFPLLFFCALILLAAPLLADDEMEMRLRVLWGNGAPQSWQGSFRIDNGSLSELHDLGQAPDSPGSKELDANQIRIRPTSQTSLDGFDVSVTGPADAIVTLELASTNQKKPPTRVALPLDQFVSEIEEQSLDDLNNVVTISRVPGDQLRVLFTRDTLVFSPGELFDFTVKPHLMDVEPDSSLRLRVQLFAAGSDKEIRSTQENLSADEHGTISPIPLAPITVPEEEGVYELVLSLHRRTRIEVWRNTQIGEARNIQFMVIAPRLDAPDLDEWSEAGSLDPTNPGWRAWAAAKIPGMSLIPGMDPTKNLSNSTPKSVTYGGSSMLELAPGQWQAYQIPIAETGRPHLLEVEFPSDLPQSLGISVIEPNEAGHVGPIGLDSGVYVPEHLATEAPTVSHHRLVFWPRTKAPLVLLVNHRRDGPAVFGRIRVFSGPEQLPPAPIAAMPSERLLAACFDKPFFAENFSSSGELDATQERVLDDWSKFYWGTVRLAEYLKYAGYNGAVICVVREGSALYPSAVLAPSPRYDDGVFFSNGQDPIRKDVLEMMFRVFDREGLQLVPAMHFSGRMQRLERVRRRDAAAAQGIALVHADGTESATHYNPLDPTVQEAMRDAVRELAQRYSQHPSFQGVAVQLAADSYSILPDDSWGADVQTFNRFRRTAFDGTEPEAMRQLQSIGAVLQNAELRRSWIQWRALELSRLYSGIYDTIREARPEGRLFLLTADMFQGRATQSILRPELAPSPTHPVVFASLVTGIDARFYRRHPGIVLFRPQRQSASFILNDQAMNTQLAAPEVDSYFRGADTAARGDLGSGAQFYCERLVLRLPSFDAVSPFGKDFTFTELHTHAGAAGLHTRQRWAHALATLDASDIVDGGWMLPLGQEENVLSFVETFRSLPRVPFQLATPRSNARTQPVVVRFAIHQGRTFFYVVNDSPWPVRASLEFSGRADLRLQTLGTRQWPLPFRRTNQWSWNLDLKPYDVVGAWLSDPKSEILDWQVQVPPQVIGDLQRRVAMVRQNAAVAVSRPPLRVLENPQFEAEPVANGIANWEYKTGDGLLVELDGMDKYDGKFSLHMSSRGSDDPMSSRRDDLWLRSNAFPPPKTGRLYVLVWLKTRNAHEQPILNVVLDDYRRFYRFETIGGGPSMFPLSDQWQEFVIPFDYPPLDRLDSLHLGFDLMTKGDVWIDDVRIFDMSIQDVEKTTMQLASTTVETDLKQNIDVTSAQQFLNGYWPRFLLAHVKSPGDDLELRAAARPDVPAANEKPKRSTIDQMRDLVPKVPFKVPFKR